MTGLGSPNVAGRRRWWSRAVDELFPSALQKVPHIAGWLKLPRFSFSHSIGHCICTVQFIGSYHRKLANLITWTTALSNSMKLRHAIWGPPKTDGSWWRGLTECGPLEKGMANHFSILALRTPWTVWKGKMTGHWKRNSPGWKLPNMLLEISGEITLERMKGWSQSKNNIQLWMWLVIEARSDAVKSNIA